MNPVITGIVIDQTRETGKWYVREVKDETGIGVKPVFFRRERSDFIGRFYDKLCGAESAQKYAAAHINQLTVIKPVDVSNIVDASGNLDFPSQIPNKFTPEDLQALLDQKCKLVDPGELTEGSQKIHDAKSLVTIISAKNNKEIKREVDRLWSNYQDTDDISKGDFKRLMRLSLQLAAGDVQSNDRKVWNECKNFVGRLASRGDAEWKNHQILDKFESLKSFFHGEKTSDVAGPLSGFRPESTQLGPDQIFDKTHWISEAVPPSNSNELLWQKAEAMPDVYEKGLLKAFEIHEALWVAMPQGQGLATVRADWGLNDLKVDSTDDILNTLRSLRKLARSDEAKQTINALGNAVAKYAEYVKTRN